MLLNNEWVNNEIKEEIKRYLETNENGNTTTQSLWDSESSPKMEMCSITGLSQTRIRSNNLTLHLKEFEKEQQTNPITSRRKKIIKIRAELNEIESKK